MTTYRQLLDRQFQLQAIGKLQGHQPFDDTDLRLAYLDEVGELIHEFKKSWSWWKKPGSPTELNREKILDEASDVVHFALIAQITEQDYEPGTDYGDYYDTYDLALGGWEMSNGYTAATPFKVVLASLADTDDWRPGCGEIIARLVHVIAEVGYTPEDLAQAYFAKTQVNLDRWEAAKTQ